MGLRSALRRMDDWYTGAGKRPAPTAPAQGSDPVHEPEPVHRPEPVHEPDPVRHPQHEPVQHPEPLPQPEPLVPARLDVPPAAAPAAPMPSARKVRSSFAPEPTLTVPPARDLEPTPAATGGVAVAAPPAPGPVRQRRPIPMPRRAPRKPHVPYRPPEPVERTPVQLPPLVERWAVPVIGAVVLALLALHSWLGRGLLVAWLLVCTVIVFRDARAARRARIAADDG